MINRYKYVISGPHIYKEIQFPESKTFFKVGTAVDVDTRLHREDFSEDFWLLATLTGKGWNLECSESVYINLGDIRKLSAVEMKLGDVFKVYSQRTEQQIFTLSFFLDCDYEKKNYDTVINLNGISGFTIGTASNCNIRLRDNYGSEELLEVFNQGEQLGINVRYTGMGCFCNGIRTANSFRVGQRDFFALAEVGFYFKDGRLYVAGIEHLQIQGLQAERIDVPMGTLVYPKFNRNTQMDISLPEEPIQILLPSEKPEKPKESLMKSLIPSVLMLVMVVVVRGFMSESGSGSYIIFSVCSMGLGIATTIASYFGGKKEYRKEIEQREQDYNAYVQEKRQEIEAAREEERILLNQKYPSGSKLYQQVMGFSGDIFDRSADKEDFARIRLGDGAQKSRREVAYAKQEKITPGDELEQIPEKIQKEFENVAGVPVCCDLAYAGNIGVVGSEGACYQMLKNMVLDVCVHHYYTDCKLFFVFEEKREKQFSYLRFLPHIQDAENNVRNIVCDEASKINRFEYLYKELCRREKLGKDVPFSSIFVFVLDDMGLYQHPVSRFFKTAGSMKVHFIFFKQSHEELPLYCGQVIDIGDDGNGFVTDAADRNSSQRFAMQPIEDQMMEKVALKIAPVYCEEISLESELTKNITLYQMLGIFQVEDLELSQRWGELDVCKTMAAPLGVKSKNQIVYLDLHEKAHGPHGLVAGTTGSGKSEIMQTYILSMATLYSPYEVAFVLIDFKGGGMANQFRNLPHLLGAITDIDGKEINRSLLSIRAELDRRKELFAQANVNNIGQYIRKFQNKEVAVALPHLIIIVDEFAELKAEQPEFMKELISASRIGRSLGVHLILATQKPAGQVSDQIWSNSRFKLCLKVQTQEDSNEVIKSPLAAEIIEPGRAYIQVGNNEIFELFQSAYSGAPDKSRDDNSKLKEYSISKVDFAGRRSVIFEQKNKKDEGAKLSQLEAIVSYVDKYCKEHGIDRLPNICLPPLPENISFPENTGRKGEQHMIGVGIGIYDAPSSQYQGEVRLNLTGENTMLIGASQYGKTNLLQTIIRSLAVQYSPKEVNMYILDFGSMFLKNYEALPHVGGVVCASDEEKFKNLFKLLFKEIAVRKDKLVSAGVSSFAAYKEAGNDDLPAIVVLVDNFTALKETYFGDDDLLLPLCRDGLAVGISVVIANAQTGGFGYRYYSVISNRLAFYCNDHDDINNLFGYCRMNVDMLPGRCLVQIDKGIYEAQTYLAFEGEREIDRSNRIKELIGRMKELYPGEEAKHIPEVPEVLCRKQIYDFAEAADVKNQIALGLDYATVESVMLQFKEQFMLGVIAKEEEARELVLDAVMSDIRKYAFQREIEVHFIDSVKKRYKDQADLPYMASYSSKAEDILEILEDMETLMEERNENVEDEGMEYLDSCPTELIIVNTKKALELISGSKQHMAIFDKISKEYRGWKIMFLFADVDNITAGFNAPEILKRIRDEKKCIVMNSLRDVKLFEMQPGVVRKNNVPLRAADAFYINGDEVIRMKMPTC